MADCNDHYQIVSNEYDDLSKHGPYATLTPRNKGGRKSRYVAAVFDAALIPRIRAIGPCERALDVGCGTGIFTRQLAEVCGDVVGMDVSSRMLRQARTVCDGLDNVGLLQTDGTRIPAIEDSFDCVVARETLCYAPDELIAATLAEIYRVTVPGGHFFWLEQVSDNPRWQRSAGAPNLVKRSPNSIHMLVKESGWELLSEQIVRTPRFPWIFPVWFSLLPEFLTPRLAAWEVALHQRYASHPRRWWNSIFVLQKPKHA